MINPAYITVIRDDEDISRNNIIYYYNLGIRNFFILLHKANRELIKEIDFAMSLKGSNFRIFSHNKDEHYHDKDCKILTDAAMDEGFSWIVGTDTDDLLVLRKHKTIQELLAEYDTEEYYSLLFEWYEYRPTHEVYAPKNAFTEFKYRDKEKKEQHKSIGKFNKRMMYVPGLHFISNSPKEIHIPFEVANYTHFPDRNRKQFIRKYKIQDENWMRRYGAFPLHDQMQSDPDFLNKFWEAKIYNDVSSLIFDPISEEKFNVHYE
jgi:hypothetical protein